jgi:amidase
LAAARVVRYPASFQEMNMSDLAFESARILAERIRHKQISSRELLELYLTRVERHNPSLNAIVTLDAEGARKTASRADEATARGESWGPLHGVPMTIKDAFEVIGVRTTAGVKRWEAHIPTRDAVAVQRLRAAGAVIFGHSNVPAYCGDVQSYNELFGTTNNPWDPARTPGGSSGGAAAALAAGLTPIEFGSDIGGSIRTPANWCGVYGHKPTHALVPQRGHMPPPPGTLVEGDLSVVGPLARTIDDLKLLLSIVAGPLPEVAHAYSLHLPPPRASSLHGYRVGTWFDDPAAPVDDAVRASLQAAADALARGGASVEPAQLPFALQELVEVYTALRDVQLTMRLPAQVKAGLRAYADSGKGDALAGFARHALASHHDWLQWNDTRERFRAAFRALFEHYDVLLLPVTSVPAIAHDHLEPMLHRKIVVNGATRSYMELFSWIAPATLCYLPATVVPAARVSGLPVGLQIVGPHLEDHTPLDVAGRVSDLIGGFERPPGY